MSGNTTTYVVLDFGATHSLITLQRAQHLGLSIQKTNHTLVQVDGQSTMKVMGEINTTFYRGKIPLKFSALVVAEMPIDILGGMNFYKENDVSACTVITTSSTVLNKNRLDVRCQLVATMRKVSVVPRRD